MVNHSMTSEPWEEGKEGEREADCTASACAHASTTLICPEGSKQHSLCAIKQRMRERQQHADKGRAGDKGGKEEVEGRRGGMKTVVVVVAEGRNVVTGHPTHEPPQHKVPLEARQITSGLLLASQSQPLSVTSDGGLECSQAM